jgi:YesN/AraC family two-component response regulator
LVAFQKDIHVVGEAANGQQAVEKFFLHRLDVLLLDFRMPEMNRMEAVHVVLEKAPKAKIIVLSTYDRDEGVHRHCRRVLRLIC